MSRRWKVTSAIALLVLFSGRLSAQAPAPLAITIAPNWASIVRVSITKITLQAVANPPLRRGSPIHYAAWESMRALHARDARMAFWYPYPRLAVAELAAPSEGQTSWDFSLMDLLIEDFIRAANGRSVFTISTIPQWMFATDAPVEIPADPNEAVWNYEQRSRLRDESLQEVASYYERVARWYFRGGFRDELGVEHASGHHYKAGYWEVLNEPEFEHSLSPEYYTRIYDAVVGRVHRVSPRLQFVGMSLAEPEKGASFFDYFLDHSHHARGIPLDAISYHFYAHGQTGETDGAQAASFFAQADNFLQTVDKIEEIRARLSPQTQTQINETGCIAANDLSKTADSMSGKGISPAYWNLCGAMFAYLFGNLSARGIDLVGASQLLGYPSQFPSVSLVDWNTGAPNARYFALQLLIGNFSAGDRLCDRPVSTPEVFSQAFRHRGVRELLLINKTLDRETVVVAGSKGGLEQHVDMAFSGIARSRLSSDTVLLGPASVMVIQFNSRH